MPTSNGKSKNRNNKKKDKTKKATEPQTSPKNPDSNDRAPSPPEIESQYHHYIPRCILKKFSDEPHVGSKNETKWEQSADGEWLEKLLKRKKLDEGFEGPPIKIYDVNAKIITIGDISKSYGIQDMYRDISLKDCMKFEKLLGKFESSAAKFVNAIVSGSNDISISRVGLFEFKQFLFIMMYRNESRRGQYLQEEFDDRTRFLIEKHMRYNNISNIQEVWFENLKWILDNPEKEIMNEVGKANMAFCQPDNFRGIHSKDAHFNALNGYDGPINVMELLDFEMLAKKYICIWEAPEGTEFILSDNGFGNHEKQSGIFIHNFFVVSPRYVVVLVYRPPFPGYGGELDAGSLFMMSMFKDLHGNPNFPACEYVKKKPRGPMDFSPNDIFKYKRIVIPKEKVWLINSIFLDARKKSISYKSDLSLYRSILSHDKNLGTLFFLSCDYSDLKRKLFLEMNRTHAN